MKTPRHLAALTTLLACAALAALVAISPPSSVRAASHNEYEGFFGATPVAQQTGPDRTALQNYGLLTTDGTTTATATSGTTTLNKVLGTITSEALTTAGGADYTLSLTNSFVTATSISAVTVDNGSNTVDTLAVGRVTPTTGTLTMLIHNTGTNALNGTVKVRFGLLR